MYSQTPQSILLVQTPGNPPPQSVESQTIYENNDFIGIGTTTPHSNLSVFTTFNQANGITPVAGLDVINTIYFNPNSGTQNTAYTPISFRVSRQSTEVNSDPNNPDGNSQQVLTFTDFIVTEKGFVGIGTSIPQTYLDVNGDAVIRGNATVNQNATIKGSLQMGNWYHGAYGNININGQSAAAILNMHSGVGGWENQIIFSDGSGDRHVITDDAATGELAFHPGYNNHPTAKSICRFDGLVKIGNIVPPTGQSATPTGYSLYVEKGVLAEKFKCALVNSTDWSDFVFDKSYKLLPIHDVADYIQTNKHLPDVPSADEVVCDGIDMAKMDATLLRKIEELTLYVIQQQKEIELLKAKK